MEKKDVKETETLSRIHELYLSLTDDGKDELVSMILESEEFMARILGALVSGDESIEMGEAATNGFVDFLRKVKE